MNIDQIAAEMNVVKEAASREAAVAEALRKRYCSVCMAGDGEKADTLRILMHDSLDRALDFIGSAATLMRILTQLR